MTRGFLSSTGYISLHRLNFYSEHVLFLPSEKKKKLKTLSVTRQLTENLTVFLQSP